MLDKAIPVAWQIFRRTTKATGTSHEQRVWDRLYPISYMLHKIFVGEL